MSAAGRLKELGALATNVGDAAVLLPAGHPMETLAHELADWVRCATGIIGEVVTDAALAAAPKGRT